MMVKVKLDAKFHKLFYSVDADDLWLKYHRVFC